MPRPEDSGLLIAALDCQQKELIKEFDTFPDLSSEQTTRTAVLLNATINHHFDVEGLLRQIAPRLSRTSRILIVAYNPYLSWLYRLANRIGLRKGEVPTTFITRIDLENIAKLAGYTIVRTRLGVYFPWKLFGFGTILNHVLSSIPIVRWFGLVYLAVLRPIAPEASGDHPSLSCVVPARNERGNIENCIRRFPNLGCDLEIIFVEGHSTDGTWEEILRVKEVYGTRFNIKAFQQSGKGKKNAVRLGFSQARGELLTILDADLTMPPELLGRFYSAYCKGHADFINGSRLVYPMEGNAMRFLNRLGNVFFAKALSWVLDTQLGDTLCGTKLLARHDYKRMVAWQRDFGDFDPFGDFELIFPAAVLGLGIVDVPIRYRNRTYGSTNISRFRHGFMLLKMTLVGLYRIKLGMGRKKLGQI
ncbi:MAG TPA: glycosyltransferase family 2 protein [Nitrospirota bacterium]|nr:glycosyltransferase family 2 protein [Nitrospirota bacterium]